MLRLCIVRELPLFWHACIWMYCYINKHPYTRVYIYIMYIIYLKKGTTYVNSNDMCQNIYVQLKRTKIGNEKNIYVFQKRSLHIEPQSHNLPHTELVHAVTHHQMKQEPTNLVKKCKTPWLTFLLYWALINLDRSNSNSLQNPVNLHCFCVFEILLRRAKTESVDLPHLPHGSVHMLISICSPTGSRHDF